MWSSLMLQAKNDNSWKISKKGALIFKSIAPQWTICSQDWSVPLKEEAVKGETIKRSKLIYLHPLQDSTPNKLHGLWQLLSLWELLGEILQRHRLKGKGMSPLLCSNSWRNHDSSRPGKDGENTKQDVSMGALKQTQKYVPVLPVNREYAQGGKKALPDGHLGLLDSHADPLQHP